MEEARLNLYSKNNQTYFKKYLKLIKSTIDAEKGAENRDLESFEWAILEENNERITKEYNKYFRDIASEIRKTEQLMYQSFVVAVFIFIESQIVSYCDQARTNSAQIFSHKDLKGTGYGRAIGYLEKILGVSFPKNPATKSRLEAAHRVRNCLVHNSGYIIETDAPIIKAFIKEHPGILEISTKNEIIITHEYAVEMISLNNSICDAFKDYEFNNLS